MMRRGGLGRGVRLVGRGGCEGWVVAGGEAVMVERW